MFAKLTALVGGSYNFPYNVEEAYQTAWGTWTHHKGTTKEDNAPVSIFKVSCADAADPKLNAARTGVKRLKLLRHPNVLAFKDSIEKTEAGQTTLYLITEAVQPLSNVIKELNLQGKHRDEYLSMGMKQVATAVSFLNNDCKMIHGNVCLAAVVVTDSLDWKLHGFDLLSEVALTGGFALRDATWMVPAQYKPAELARSEWAVIQQSPPWAVDAWGLGCLLQEAFSGGAMKATEELRRTDIIPKELLPDYQKLLSSQPAKRLNPSAVADNKFLSNKLVEVVQFMENIAVRDALEKDIFFKKLPQQLPAVAVRKILPLLSSALEFGGAPATAVGSLLLIGKSLDAAEFQKRVVPCVTRLFASTDRGVRRNLLETIDQYGPHLTQQVVEEQIYPQLASGFEDANGYIRELTLKSVLQLAPKMSQKTLVQGVLKHLSKLQVDPEPSIRANTTVLLGNIAKYLGEATCRKVLLNAFARALKDSFPPARVAGLRALVATSEYYSPEEVAARVLPAVAPSAVDPIPDVRAGSLLCLDTFGKVLIQHDAKLTREAAAAAASSQDGGATAAGGGSSGMGGMGAASALAGGSMLSWAVSSLMSTVGNQPAKPPMSAPMAAAAAIVPPVAAVATTAAISRAGLSAEPSARASTGRTSTASSSKQGSDAGDGWDDDDLVEAVGALDPAEAAARSRLTSSRTAGSSNSSSSSRPPLAGSSPYITTHVAPPVQRSSSAAAADGWAADENDGWEDMNTTSPGAQISTPASPAGRPLPARTSSGVTTASARAPGRAPSAKATGAGSSAREPTKKLGAMKLGATKLGATKLSAD